MLAGLELGVKPAQALLRQPMNLRFADGQGLRLPPGEWPRLRRGVAKDDSLQWDVLLVRALALFLTSLR